MDGLIDPQAWVSVLTLTALEIVLGIDNLVFVAILTGRLPEDRRDRARQIGLALALFARLLLLAAIVWIIGLTRPLLDLLGHPVSWRDLVLTAGGLFLLYKATREIHHRLEGDDSPEHRPRQAAAFGSVVVQIMLLDVVFSLDSVVTAVGMADRVWVMATAIVIAVAIMVAAAKPLAGFIERHPTVKMLALSFLVLIGTALIADGVGLQIPKGYIYAAIGFSAGVETLNQLAARRRRASFSAPGEREAPPPLSGA